MARRSKRSEGSPRSARVWQSAHVEPAASRAGELRWSWPVRALLTAAITYHLCAVFIGAWVGSPPTSPLADEVARPFRPYIAVADLNHGYRFFAPNPGPSHVYRYRVTFDDGSTRDGYFPNRSEHWPRLLYHRYFMLSENLNTLLPRQLAADEQAPPPESMTSFRALAQSYAAQILRTSGAEKVEWELVRHYQASPDEVLAGQSLLAEGLYAPVGSGKLERKELP